MSVFTVQIKGNMRHLVLGSGLSDYVQRFTRFQVSLDLLQMTTCHVTAERCLILHIQHIVYWGRRSWPRGLILYVSYCDLWCSYHGDIQNSFTCWFVFHGVNCHKWNSWEDQFLNVWGHSILFSTLGFILVYVHTNRASRILSPQLCQYVIVFLLIFGSWICYLGWGEA